MPYIYLLLSATAVTFDSKRSPAFTTNTVSGFVVELDLRLPVLIKKKKLKLGPINQLIY